MAGTRTKKIVGGGVRDDRPKRRRSKSSKSPVPVKFWFTVGMAASVLTFVLSGTSNTSEPDITQGGGYHAEEKKEPVFDFYTLLPESEVVVSGGPNQSASIPLRPAPKPAVVKPAPKPEVLKPSVVIRPAPVEAVTPKIAVENNSSGVGEKKAAMVSKPASTARYLLQIGSFRHSKDADRLRGELLLNGFEPRVQTVTVRGNEKWHRVQLGPFSGKKQAAEVRIQLTERGIDSIMKQQK